MREGGTTEAAAAAMRVFFAFVFAVAVAARAAEGAESLCFVPGCDCTGAAPGTVTHVVCNCVENQVRRG